MGFEILSCDDFSRLKRACPKAMPEPRNPGWFLSEDTRRMRYLGSGFDPNIAVLSASDITAEGIGLLPIGWPALDKGCKLRSSKL